MPRRFKRSDHDRRKACRLLGRKGATSVFNILLSPVTLLVFIIVVTATLSFNDESDAIRGMTHFTEDEHGLSEKQSAADSSRKLEKSSDAPLRNGENMGSEREHERVDVAAKVFKKVDSVSRAAVSENSTGGIKPKTNTEQIFGVEEAIGKSYSANPDNGTYQNRLNLATEGDDSPPDEPRSTPIQASEVERKDGKSADSHVKEVAPTIDSQRAPDSSPSERVSKKAAGGKPRKLPTVEKKLAAPGIKVAAEYGGSHVKDGSGLLRGQNVTRLSYAIYKVVRLFHLKKLVDFPAASHVEWMPEMVTRFEYDVPGFMYDGYDVDDEKLKIAERAGEAYGSANFRVVNPEVEMPESGSDIFLVWTELDGTRSDPRSAEYFAYIVSVVKAAKKANIKYIIFGQFPRMKGMIPIYSKGKWRFMGKSREEVRRKLLRRL